MRRVDLGGGDVAFEVSGPEDRVAGLDPAALRERGWPEEAIRNYERYQNGSEFLGVSRGREDGKAELPD